MVPTRHQQVREAELTLTIDHAAKNERVLAPNIDFSKKTASASVS